ncbi:MAG: hypothetical protein HRU32_15415 [Rhodobacteraceae bacterium]|nr:hypothetical protein [Paracoccaceae bacterium]
MMDHASIDAKARDILRGNDRGGYTLPTEGLYPYQWNWDSAFAAIGFAQFDVDRAWTEIETLMSGQWPNGMVPHILFHVPDPGYFPGPDVWGTDGIGPIASSGISQPPVAATAARAIIEKAPDQGRDRLAALFPKLKAWHSWFMTWRNAGGAIFITHPWEGGRDNAPDWDAAMAAIDPVGVGEYTRRDTSHVDPSMRPTKDDYDRYIWLVQRGRRLGWDEAEMAKDMPFKVADPLTTFVLLRANRDLAAIADLLGEDRAEIDRWTAEIETGVEALRNAQGVFDSINLRSGLHTGCVTSSSFLCWYAGVDSDAMRAELAQTFESCPYPIPSQKVESEHFDAKRYWRGPTWGIVNAMIARGLSEMGLTDEASRLTRQTRTLMVENGFAEYYNPLTGAPAGGGTFTWTAAVWLAWASPTAGEA